MSNIGLLGGTFNPLHLGHIEIAKTAYAELKLDKILFLPSGKPALKSENNLLGFEKRCRIIELALQDYPNFELSRLDNSRGKKSYTSELLRKLKSNSNNEYFFIIGEDNVTQLPLWHDYEWLIENANITVVSRNIANRISMMNVHYYDKLNFIQMKTIDISSTTIRELVSQNKSITELVPEKCEKLILEFYN